MKTYVRGYGRCKWMAIVSIIFTVMTVAFIIPGALGISPGGNHYNDTLFYLAMIDLIFAILFLIGWLMCQFEVDDVIQSNYEIAIKSSRSLSTYGSMRSTHSVNSISSQQLLTLGGNSALSIEKNA